MDNLDEFLAFEEGGDGERILSRMLSTLFLLDDDDDAAECE